MITITNFVKALTSKRRRNNDEIPQKKINFDMANETETNKKIDKIIMRIFHGGPKTID